MLFRSGLAAPCAGAGEDVVVFECEGDRLLLDEGRARETEILQGAKNERGYEMREQCECSTLFNHSDDFVLSLRSNS